MSDVQPVPGDVVKDVPQITAPSNNRMIIAFPFSAVRISQPDENVAKRAAMLGELTEFVAKEAASPEAAHLADRARVLTPQIKRAAHYYNASCALSAQA